MQKVLNAFESGIFLMRKQGKRLTSISDCVAHVAKVRSDCRVSDRKQLEILTLKQMFQRLPITLAQVKRSDCRVSDRNQLEILTLKQMFQRLPITVAQVKADNTYENSLNEIRQIIYYFY